jgi:hypothetical protein
MQDIQLVENDVSWNVDVDFGATLMLSTDWKAKTICRMWLVRFSKVKQAAMAPPKSEFAI